jgi:hypothetical protein
MMVSKALTSTEYSTQLRAQTSSWWPCKFSKEEVLWWRHHSMNLPTPTGLASDGQVVLASTDVETFGWLKESGGKFAPHVRVTFDEEHEYDLHAARKHARKTGDATKAAHGAFKQLAYRNHFHAVQFLQKFGCLEWNVQDFEPGTRSFWLSLDQFWAMQRRFTAVTKLWDTRGDLPKLRQAWREFYKYKDEIERADPNKSLMGTELTYLSLEDLPADPPGEFLVNIINREVPPLYRDPESFEKWAMLGSPESLRRETTQIVLLALNHYVSERKVRWRPFSEEGNDGFRLEIGEGSLWARCWEFYALDTSDGPGWRICPHCSKVFYPKRKDRFYCTVREQALASKRHWASNKRTESPIE